MNHKSIKRYEIPSQHINLCKRGRDDWKEKKRELLEDLDPLKYISPNDNKKILNLGGIWTEAMAYKDLGYNIITVTLLSDMEKILSEDNFQVVFNDMCDMIDVKNDSIDGIFSRSSLEHVFYPWKALLEMWRVLKVGGRALVHTPWWGAPYQGDERPDYKEGSIPVTDKVIIHPYHPSVFTPLQLQMIVRSCGFKIIDHNILPRESQRIYFEKISIEELKKFEPDPGHKLNRLAGMLENYCKGEY